MTFPRRLLLCVTALLLCAAAFSEAAADDLRKWIPGNGLVYGELSASAVLKSPLFARLKARYPKLQSLMDQKREQFGSGLKGELDTLDFMFGGQNDPGFALLFAFDQAFDQNAILNGLDAKGMKGKYEKFSVGGKTGYVFKEQTGPFGRTGVVLLSDRVMLCCPERSAETMVKGPKIPADLGGKLRTGEGGVFLRLLPGPAQLPPEADVRDYELTGTLNADSSLKLASRVALDNEEAAKNLEQQIRAYLFTGVGLLFADNGELGMDLVNQVKIKRSGTGLLVDVLLPADLIERLAEFSIAQAEKRRKEQAERARRNAERRRQAQQQQGAAKSAPAKSAPAKSGTTSAR